MQSPAEGLWTEGDRRTGQDDIVMMEVMVDNVARAWWEYRERLDDLLRQESIVIRVVPMERL